MKEGTYMSELNYITEMLELKDNNIKFYENCYHKEKIKFNDTVMKDKYKEYCKKYEK